MSEHHKPKTGDRVRLTIEGEVGWTYTRPEGLDVKVEGTDQPLYVPKSYLAHLEKIGPALPTKPGSVIRHQGLYLWALNKHGNWVSLEARSPEPTDHADFGEFDVVYDAGAVK